MKNELPTIDIHGKPYVMVKDKVAYFNEKHPNGSIQTEIVKNDSESVVFKAVAIKDVSSPNACTTGHSEAYREGSGIEGSSPIEVAETSAIGRALSAMGIGVVDSFASAEEVKKAGSYKPAPVTQKQIEFIQNLESMKGVNPIDVMELKSSKQASGYIEKLQSMPTKFNDKAKTDVEIEVGNDEIPVINVE